MHYINYKSCSLLISDNVQTRIQYHERFNFISNLFDSCKITQLLF